MRHIWQISSAVEDALWQAASVDLGEFCNSTAELASAIEDRSRRYTSDRETLSAPRSPRADLAARALFFSVADAAKIQVPLAEVLAKQRLDLMSSIPLRVADLGAGCGAMSLGLVDFWARSRATRPLDIVLVERDGAALKIAASALRAFAKSVGVVLEITSQQRDLTDNTGSKVALAKAAIDLLLVGTVLNEMSEQSALDVVMTNIKTLTSSGLCIVIEPALRHTSRALHRLRDNLCQRGGYAILAPCVHSHTPCPALSNQDDWCHEERLGKLPPRAAELSRITHLRDDGLKFSYLTIAHSVDDDQRGAAQVNVVRIVRQPRGLKGKIELLGCGAAGWVPLRLLRRNRTDDNRVVQDAHRGDIVVLPSAVDHTSNGIHDIQPTDRVEVITVATEPSPASSMIGAQSPPPT
jgi:ribosomal protein RSM22 (predicted rRNA methylase)